MPLFTKEDLDNLKNIAIKYRFDYVSLPHVQTGKDIEDARMALGDAGSRIGILAQIDTSEAIHQFEGIVKHADGVVIVRDALAYEFSPEKLMLAQKWMINRANMEACPVFLQN